MKQKLKDIVKGPVVFYPLLFAAFPILFLYAYNIRETSMSQVWLPLGVSVAGGLVLWAILSLILSSLSKAGIATAIFLLFFFSYGHFYIALETWGVFVPKHAYLLPSMLFIWGYCVYFINRAKRDFRITAKVLNIVAAVLIAINLFNIASYQIKLARINMNTQVEAAEQTADSLAKLSDLPDIYQIILDEYASLSTIKEHYGYENSDFANELTDEGFFIAQESRTHIAATEYSISSLLNMEYIGHSVPLEIVHKRIADNEVAKFLKSKGYSFIHIGTFTIGADLYYNPNEFGESNVAVDEFLRIAWNTTMLNPFYMYIFGTQFDNSHRAGVMGSIELLKSLPEMPGPKFVYAHIMCPHDPFVFSASGGHVGAGNFYNYVDRSLYLGQYIFITNEIEEVIMALLEKSETSPIIILQSDHGVKTLGQDDSTRIFNAIYLPDNGSEYLYDSMPQVNTYRLIFNLYFGTNYTMLEYTAG